MQLRLKGHTAPDGELSALEGVALIEAFRDLIYRVTRAAADRQGLGRTDSVLEQLSSVRFGLKPGSTTITFEIGDDAALDVEDSISQTADQNFWQLARDLSQNERSPTVSESVASQMSVFVRELKRNAVDAEIAGDGHPTIKIRTADLNRDIWSPPEEPGGTERTVHGVLEMVDLHTARFRIRDVAHNTVELRDVVDAAAAAKLVGSRVTAQGRFVDRESTPRMVGVIVSASDVPGVLGRVDPDLEQSVQQAAIREPEPIDLSPEELDDFLASIHA
ncbi:hypothetical protein [Enemella evansiae]|uniref:hypothetical protein n=1 Tax=Enemella evansiae TaxID=2016499 RepID=UPI00117CAB34|nr:hypothetical protein [Enemella evansiae]